MPFLAPEMQQVLAGILVAILWTYFQGGRMCFKKMKSDKIELLRSDCNGKTAGNSFAYCLVDDVKHYDDDVERHEVRCVYWRRVPTKLAFLGENTRVFSIGWVIKQLFHGCLAE